ncbi:MAG: L,D-transpeptidase [Rhodanobacter denitrificans]|uniref:L,D-transpeptidase n=1 Tax=Rhodanobacter denitrificans TaxID=666685 RepID=A0A2W5JYV3_9GAMM|nr:MAG: L,D-transpeptidase [Rhodanobacter denitrificans]
MAAQTKPARVAPVTSGSTARVVADGERGGAATARGQPAKAGTAAAEPDPAALAPGQFLWHPEIAPAGPLVLVVSLDEQRAYAYRNGIAIGVSTISSGKPGKDTPTGVFTILQKSKDHRSNLYNSAPMPYMQRLTWDGIALHGGSLPGYPASHGCVRLPKAFAEKLFAVTQRGDTVVVADGKASAATVVHPAMLAPVAVGGAPTGPAQAALGDEAAENATGAEWAWDDASAPDGPLSVLVSLRERRVFVLRNGVGIGEARLGADPDLALRGSVLLVMGDRTEDAPSVLDPERPRHQWTIYPILGDDTASIALLQLRLQQARPLALPPPFARRLYAALSPGATVLLTDLPAVRATPTGQALQPVLESDPPSPAPAP